MRKKFLLMTFLTLLFTAMGTSVLRAQESYVAKVGSTEYAKLADAVNAAQADDEIKVIANIATNLDLTISKKVTLDLGGFTLSDAGIIIASDVTIKNGEIVNTNEPYPLKVTGSGNLTVDGVAIKASNSDRAIYLDGSSPVLNFMSGSSILATKGPNNTKSKIYGVWVSSGATANIYGGTITVDAGADATAVAIFGNYVNTVNIYGGKISTSGKTYSYAVWVDGNVTITGGEIVTNEKQYGYSSGITYGKNYAINSKGNVEISGDTKITTYGPSGYIVNAGGSNQKVNIADGEFTNVLSEADTIAGGHSAPNLIYGSSVDATIAGGDFNGYKGEELIKGTGSTLTITGGSFDNMPKADYVAVGATITVGETTYTKTEDGLEVVIPVASVNGTSYATLDDALAAASAMTGDVTVEIYKRVTLDESLSGSYSSIKFVGKDTDAEIYLDVQGYITATGKNVAFEDLKLSKSEGGFINNAGFMNVAFGVYDVTEVTYTNCVFANGAYASSGNVTYTGGCIFKRSHDKYGLWAYGNVDVTVDGCIFDDYRGIKMYAEGAAKTVDLTVKNTNFSAVNDKPAIVLTYGESVTLENNTYSSTGVFELDLDGAPNGTPINYTDNNDEKLTCKNDNGACGVLCDGKIYTTVAQAAEVATSGSTVTLLHNSTETVELPAGVILDKNGYEAAGITVTQPVAQVGETPYYDLQEAIKAAAPSGTVEILSDVTVDEWIMFSETLNIGSGQIITMNIDGLTIDGKDHTITINSIESAGNGGYLIFDAINLNVKDLTINYADGLVGGIGLSSGTISNVTFNGGNYGVFPGANGVTIEDCTFNGTKSSAVYYEEGRQGIVVENNIFNTADGAYAITMRSDEQFTGNTINKGRVNIANSSSATVTGNNFGQERFKVYNAATATISGNTINKLVFNDNSVVNSTFTENTLSDAAQAVLENANFPVAQIGTVKYGTLNEALNAAAQTEELTTIQLLAGTHTFGNVKFPATLKNVTIVGADNKATIIKDSKLYSADGNAVTYKGITFDGIVFDNSSILFTGARSGEVVYEDWTIKNCDFRDLQSTDGIAAIHFNFLAKETIKNFTFENNTITNVTSPSNSASGLRLNYVTGDVVIKDNETNNVAFNAVQIINSEVDNFTFEGNILRSNSSSLANLYNVTGENIVITKNQFLANEDQESVSNIAYADVSGNYWGGGAPTNLPEGVVYSSYYTTVESDGTLGGLVELPQGNQPIGYVSETTIWGQTWANAKESYVIKVLNEGNEVMGTSALNTSLDVTMDGDVEVTWHITLPGITDGDQYWIQEWTADPSIYNMPAKVALWVDGVEVNEGPVKLNGPDDIDMIYAAVTDEDGKIYSYHTSIADAITAINNNNTRSVTPNVIALLRNTDETVTLPAGIKLNLNGHEAPNVSVPVAQIGETPYYTLAEAVAAAQSGATITLLNGEHELPLFAGKELTFKGESKEGVIVNDAPAATTQGWLGSTFHFENLTAKGATANYHGLANGVLTVTYKDCNINGLRFLYATEGVSFDGCAFNAEGVEHSFWTYGASNVTVNNCTFKYTDRAVNCYSENGANHELDITFTGCTFTYAGTNATPEGAVEINSGSVKSIDLVMNGCTAPENGEMWFISQWDSKHGANTLVIVDEVVVWIAPAKIGETKYATLQEALDAAAAGTGNITVEILDDINLTNVDWNPVTVSAPGYPLVTVEGNGKTITGLNDMLFAGTWAGNSGLIIKNLTIKESNIVHDENDTAGTIGVGAFIGFPQASATITLNNCHLVNSTVNGGHWTGGLIGYSAGYAGNDGPVFMNLTITECSVTGSTITGKGSAGGIIGHGSGNGWTKVVIEETTVSGNTITSTGTSNNKAGAIMGTIGAAGQPTTVNGVTHTGGAMVAATVSGNTVTSGGTAITTIYGRQGTDTGILELAGGSYDNYPIEQNVAYAKPAAGLMIELNDNGTYGLVPDPAYGKVAMIGETYYETLQEAVTVGGEVKVIANITLDQIVTVAVDKTVVLDLNGKTISTSAVETSYAINNLGTLTLKDSSEGKTGEVNARGIYNGYDEDGNHVATAKIIVESGTYNAKGTNGGAAIFNYGIAEINGGTFTSIGGYSLSNQSGSSITVADGVTANNGIYISNGVLTINGGDIDGDRSGCHVVYAWNSTVTINGGDFYNNNSGNATIMAAGTTQMTIKGGIFGIKDGRVPGNANTWTSCLTDTQDEATMIVIGGTFNGGFRVQDGTTMTIEGGSFNDCFGSGYNIYGTATVKGGTFTDNAAITFARNYLADGFKLEENADGTYGVVPFVEKSYEIKENTTLADAIAQAKEDGAEIVTYIIYGAATLETGFSHGIVDFGGEEGYITIKGANVNTRSEDSFTITGGGVPDIKGVTFKDLTFYDEGTYLPTANEFMYQNFIDCTFENVKFEDGIRLSGNCTIKDCEVNANTTNEYAIWLDEGEFEITGTDVEAGNDAYGMIKSDNADKITITDNTFTYLGKVNKEALNTNGATIIAEDNTFIDCAKGIVPADKVNYTADGTTPITDAIIAYDNEIIIYVAKIGDVKYQSLAEAATAATTGQTIQLLWAEGHAPIAMNASLYGNKTVTITGTATVDWSKGWLFVGRGGEGDATLIFDGAILTSNEESLANGSYGIHVSAKEGDEVNKNYGKVIFKNSDVQLSFLANRNNVEVDGGKLYVHYGFWVGGRPSIETPDGFDGTATMDIKNGAVVVVNNHNGMGLGHESNGIMNIDAISTFETTQSFLVTANGTMNNAGTVNITGTLTNNGIINFTGLDAKLTAQGGLTIVDQVNNPDYAIAYLDGTYQYAKYVAQIGEAKYLTLQEAIDAAQNGETITLLVDVEQTDGVIIDSKNIVVDLNEKTFTVTEGANTSNRNFKIKGTSVVTIKNGTMVAAGEYSLGAYGTVRTEGTANVTLTGLKLYNYRGNGLNIKALGGTTVAIDNTEIYSEYGGGIEAAGGTITLAETVKVEQKGMYTAPYNSMAISVNGEGLVTVNGGTYSTECMTAEEAGNQGTSHGPWVVGVLNSGGTLIINGGTFSNDNYGDNSLATYARGAVLADTGAEIEIYGGTFNALKAIIDITNNSGDPNNNPSALLSGGTFSADPTISGLYASELIVVADGYIVVNNDGTYSVVEDQVAKIGDETYKFLHEAFNEAEDGDEIVVLKDITYTKANGYDNGGFIDGLVYTGDKSFTVNFGGHTITDNGEINDYLVYLKNTGVKENEITFKNGKIAINAESTNTAWAAIIVGSNSATYKTTLNLNEMEVVNGNPNETSNQVIRTRNGATVNLNDKTVVTSNGTSYGVVAETGSTVNIKSGAKVVQQESGTTGGNEVYTAVSGNGIINIYDGATIVSDNYAIHNMTTGNTVINIFGGTITAPVVVHVATNGGVGESAVANISGGIFTGLLETYTNAASIVITGGTFSVDPTAYCADGYEAEQIDNNKWMVIQVSGTQTRSLQAGWNWFSSYVDLSQEGGLLKLQTALGESGLAIKGQTENQSVQYVKIGVVEGEEIYAWTGNQNWNPYSNKMYMIKTSKAMSAEEFGINGDFIDYENATIALFQGWNWISYPLNEPALINEALYALNPTQGDQIKFRGSTFAEYYNGKWYPEDFVFMPGEGYMYKAESPNSFVYTKGTTNVRATNKTDENNNWMAQTSEYANNMTITAMLSIDGEIVKGNYEVAAFANGECRGSARPIYIEAIDAYVLYMTIYGDEVEELTFMYYDIDKDTEYELSNVMNYSNDAIVGTLSDPYIFSMNILGIGENSIDNINIYPNPTTTDREINLQATCDKVEVFNALGVKVAEYHNVDTLDALETAGIYVIRITNDNAVKHCRLVVK